MSEGPTIYRIDPGEEREDDLIRGQVDQAYHRGHRKGRMYTYRMIIYALLIVGGVVTLLERKYF